jgi:hypothetical protein
MKLKTIILLSVCVAASLASQAQIRLDPFYPYSKWTVGGAVGFSEIYGNLNHSNSEPVYRINVERNANAWTSLNVEVMHGALSDYESKNHWTNGMNVHNQFTAIDVTGRMSIGQLFKYPKNFFCKTIFGLYVGAGVGYMSNYISNITVKFHHQDKYLITDYNSNNIKTHTTNFFIPMNLGFNLHLTRRCMFNVNYQFNYAFSDYLDGYNFQQPTANNRYNCMFSVFSFGLNFYIGQVGIIKNVQK